MLRHETRRALTRASVGLALALAAACATQGALGAQPASAQSCAGTLAQGKAANDTQYGFSCDFPISGRYLIEARGGAGEAIDGTVHDPSAGFACVARPPVGEEGEEGEGEEGERESEAEGPEATESMRALALGPRVISPLRPRAAGADLSTWECTGGSAAAGERVSGRFTAQKEPCSVALSLRVVVYATAARKQRPVETVLKLSCSGAGGSPEGKGPAGQGRPRISALRISPASFRAAGRGGSVAVAVGAAVSYRLSVAATTTFTAQRIVAGVKSGGRCVSARQGHGARCTRYVSVGSFKRAGAAGPNRFRFTGRVAGRKLAPGPYRLQLRARSKAGLLSAAVHSAPFHLVR